MSTEFLANYDTVFIDGEWLPAATRDRIQVVSPWSEEVIASVPSGSREDIDRAVGAARRAFRIRCLARDVAGGPNPNPDPAS